jgi:hypothetical protein
LATAATVSTPSSALLWGAPAPSASPAPAPCCCIVALCLALLLLLQLPCKRVVGCCACPWRLRSHAGNVSVQKVIVCVHGVSCTRLRLSLPRWRWRWR